MSGGIKDQAAICFHKTRKRCLCGFQKSIVLLCIDLVSQKSIL